MTRMNENTVAKGLAHVLADSYTLMIKTHNYHWNVEGPHFKMLHELFEEQYTDLFTAVDDIAERIRALGEKAPGSHAEFLELSALKDGDSGKDANSMVEELVADNETLADRAHKVTETAAKSGDKATEDMLIGRIMIHQKAVWMMRSSLR